MVFFVKIKDVKDPTSDTGKDLISFSELRNTEGLKTYEMQSIQTENGIFNVGSGTPTSINELSAIIHNYIKCEISYNIKESNIKGIWLNINKIKQLISYNPICLDEGLVLSGIKDF